MYDVVIVGGGPAGLTCAINTSRANLKTLLIESVAYGGQIVRAANVENYPGIKSILGAELGSNLYEQATSFGCEFLIGEVTSIEKGKVFVGDKEIDCKNIVIATGCNFRKLGLENETRLRGKGISYCATCDGGFFKNKDVAVVGGGNTALEDAIYLSNICNKVYLIHRRDKFRGDKLYINNVKSINNIECIMNTNIKSINGEDMVDSIDLDNGDNLKINGLFIAIGQTPNNKLLDGIVKLNEFGYAVSNDLKTDIDNIYVIGDIREKDLRQLTTAISDGAIVSDMIIKNS